MRYLVLIAVTLILAAPWCFAEESAVTRLAGESYGYMCSGPIEHAVVSSSLSGKVASCGDIEINQQDVDKLIGEAPEYVREQLKSYPTFALGQKLIHVALSAEATEWAEKNGKSIDDENALIGQYLAAVLPDPVVSESEIKEFYEKNQETFHGAAFDQVKGYVEKYLKHEKTNNSKDQFVNSIGKRHKIEISTDWLKTQSENWERNQVETARKSGKPSFIAFSTVGCCDKMTPVIEKVRSDHGDAVNAIFINISREQVLSNLYKVKSSPLLFFFDKDGKEVARHNENLTVEQVKTKLAEIGVK